MRINAQELVSEIIAKLNKAGYTGGFYKYNKGECSCCYGLQGVDFEINQNIPGNWGISLTGGFYYKISYDIADEAKQTEFRKSANKLVRKYFGKMAETAKNNNQAIIINIK